MRLKRRKRKINDVVTRSKKSKMFLKMMLTAG